MASNPFEMVRLDEIPASGNWSPIRRHLGIQSFGINAWRGEQGEDVIGEHDESTTGHEELYLVMQGRVVFTVSGEDVDAPAGTIVLVRDPGARRKAVAAEPGTVVLTVGAKPGAAYHPLPWEANAEILPLFDRGEYEEAKRRLEALVAQHPESANPLYNLACAEAQLGEAEAALEHLARAVEIDASVAKFAQDDPDLASIKADPSFPGLP
jgi:tetratricopeptide (TPR) repeat protein